MAQNSASLETMIPPKVVSALWGMFVVCWIVSVGLLCVRILPLVYGREGIPLHYNIYVGIDAFGVWWMLGLVPVVSLCTALVNILVCKVFFARRPVFVEVSACTTAFIGVLTVLAVLHIVFITLAYG